MVDISINNMKNNYSYVKIRMFFFMGFLKKPTFTSLKGFTGASPSRRGTPFWTSPGMGDLSKHVLRFRWFQA